MLKALIVLFLITLQSSCGLKVVSEINTNVIKGTWRLEKILCYANLGATVSLEEYFVAGTDIVDLVFENNTFVYSVSTQSTVCLSGASGSYSTSFDGSKEGNINLSLVTTSSPCTLNLNDITGNAGTVTVPMSLIVTDINDLYWQQQEEALVLENFTDFNGSLTSSSCGDQCFCTGEYFKVN